MNADVILGSTCQGEEGDGAHLVPGDLATAAELGFELIDDFSDLLDLDKVGSSSLVDPRKNAWEEEMADDATDIPYEPTSHFVYEGWLTKLEYKSGKWHRRWFQLRAFDKIDSDASCSIHTPDFIYDMCAALVYSGAPPGTPGVALKSKMSHGRISIMNGSGCRLVPPGSEPPRLALQKGVEATSPVPDFCIGIVPPKGLSGERAYYLVADSQQECYEWLKWLLSTQHRRQVKGVSLRKELYSGRTVGLAALLAQTE